VCVALEVGKLDVQPFTAALSNQSSLPSLRTEGEVTIPSHRGSKHDHPFRADEVTVIYTYIYTYPLKAAAVSEIITIHCMLARHSSS